MNSRSKLQDHLRTGLTKTGYFKSYIPRPTLLHGRIELGFHSYFVWAWEKTPDKNKEKEGRVTFSVYFI